MPCNIPGPGTNTKDFETQLKGCICSSCCEQEECGCLLTYGCLYNLRGDLSLSSFNAPYQKPIIECSRNCSCDITCSNRVVQKGIRLPLEVFETDLKGFGLRTKSAIRRCQFVCEYAGEVLTHSEAKRRTRALLKSDNNYCLALHEHLHNGDVVSTYVDPTCYGNVGRFINHSCDPNLFMVPVRFRNNVPHLALFATRDITVNEELSYDYSGELPPSFLTCNSFSAQQMEHNSFEKNSDSAGTERKPCYCGAKQCRKYLPFDKSLFDSKPLDS